MDPRDVVNAYSPRELLVFARDPGTPEAVLTVIGLSAFDPLTRFEVAVHERTPPGTLELMGRDADEWVREGVAQNRNTPGVVLARLAGHDWKFAGFVAGNVGAPAALLERLYESGPEQVRIRVAGNTNASSSLLARIAVDPGSGRAGVVARGNPSTPAGLTVPPLVGRHGSDGRRRIAHGGPVGSAALVGDQTVQVARLDL